METLDIGDLESLSDNIESRNIIVTSEGLGKNFLNLGLMDNLLEGRRVFAQLLSEGVMWDPTCRFACRYLGHHLVNLLKRQALGLGHEEVGEGDADCASGAPEEEDLRTEIGFILVDKIRGDDGNDAVPRFSISLCREIRGGRILTRTSWRQ